MGTIANKLTYLNETKEQFKDRINSLGGEITNNTSFRDYFEWTQDFYDGASNKTDLSVNGIVGRTSQETITEEQGTTVSNTNIYVNDVNINKEHTIEISGNTYQDTTTGKNLFDINETPSIIQYNTYSITNNKITFTNTAPTSNPFAGIEIPIKLKNNTEYTISFKVSKNSSISSIERTIYIVKKQATNNFATSPEFLCSGLSANTSSENKTLTFTTTQEDYFIRIYAGTNVESVASPNYYENIQIEEGSTATEFEPFTFGASPNPDYPQNIEIVTGTQDVKVCGKNLANFSDCTSYYYNAGLPTNPSVPSMITSKTSNSYNITYTANQYLGVVSSIMNLAPNTQYTISFNRSKNTDFSQRLHILNVANNGTYSLNKAINSGVYGSPYSYTFTTNEIGRTAFMISVNNSSPKNQSETITNIQLEKGAAATIFESYTGSINKISLPTGKNLLFISSEYDYTQYGVKGEYNVLEDSFTISGTATASNNAQITRSIPLSLEAGTYTLSISKPLSKQIYLHLALEDGEYQNIGVTAGQTSNTVELSKGTTAYNIRFGVNNGTTYNETIQIQLEKGENATPISHFGNAIELYKIENYQDKIYKKFDKWYLEKQIDKNIINTNNISIRDVYTNIDYAVIPKKTDDIAYNSYWNPNSFKCNVGTYVSHPTWDNSANIGKISGSAEKFSYWLGFEKGTSLETMKEILSNNNAVIYYTLATPVITEITDTTLIAQLNALYNAQIYSVTNIGTDTINLLPYIDLHYNFVTPAPSPDRSSEIINLTGNINYKIEGKNLLNIINYSSFGNDLHNNGGNTTHTIENNKILVTTSAGSLNSGVYIRPLGNYVDGYDSNKTYTISFDIKANQELSFKYGYSPDTITTTIGTTLTRLSVETKIINNSGLVFYSTQNRANDTIEIFNIMISESEDTSYEQYVGRTFNIPLGDIELCEVGTGTYKRNDKIYSSNGKLYLEKNIDKTIFNGTEQGWWVQANEFRCYLKDALNTSGMICNYFKNGWTGNHTSNIYYREYIAFRYTELNDDLDDWKNWLSTHNTIVYYPLITPTTTEITQENYPSLYNALKDIQKYLTQYKINKEFILDYNSLTIQY